MVERFGPDLALQMAIFECLGYPRKPGSVPAIGEATAVGFHGRVRRPKLRRQQ